MNITDVFICDEDLSVLEHPEFYATITGLGFVHGPYPFPEVRKSDDFKKAFKILQAFETRYKKLIASYNSDKVIAKVVEARKRERELPEPKHEPEPEPKEEPEPKKPKQVAQGDGSTPPPVPLPGGKPAKKKVRET